MTDPTATRDLADSIGAVGQLMAVVTCAQHPDRVLSGKHRLKSGAKAVFALDVDEKARQLGVSHDAAEQILTMHYNIQRAVTREEREQEISALARQLRAEGVPDGQVASRIIALTRGVVGRSWVYDLLDKEFKNKARSESISESKKPYSKGLSELASQHVEKTATPAKVKLQEIVTRAIGPHWRDEEQFDRGEYKCEDCRHEWSEKE